MITYREVAGPALVALEERCAAKPKAIATPFDDWNRQCMGIGGQIGLAHGWHVLAAGRSGEGKTYLAVNVAAVAIHAGEGVVFHTLEMDWDALSLRLMAIASGKELWRLNPGKNFSRADFREAREALDMERGKMVINDEPMYKLSDLLAGVRRTFEETGSRLHIVDYLQLAWTGNAETQADRITEVSHGVRQLAKDLRIVTFCLSQFNRSISASKDRPQKEGMIGGSALENDSDQVVLLDHSRRVLFRNRFGKADGWDGWLLLDKNRHGPAIDIPIRFAAETGRMRQRLQDEVSDGEERRK